MSSTSDIKLINLAPYIYNRNSFYVREHPEYHPLSTQYFPYWESQEKRIIHGFWNLDQESGRDPKTNKLLPNNTNIYNPSKPGGWRFMTPQHYWYTNFCFIQHLPDSDAPPSTIMPDARDIDWYWFYIYLCALGFSGFTLDDNHSSHYLLKKYEDYLKPGSKVTFDLTPKEKKLWKKIQPNVINSKTGDYKLYVDPIEYLSKTHDKPLGDILYENPMENLADLEARGGGKSYRMMGVLSHTFNFFGARTFEHYLNIKKGPTICVGSAHSNKSGELLQKFLFSQEQLTDSFGAYSNGEDEYYPGFFHKETSGLIKDGNEKNPYRHQYKSKEGGIWKNKGTRTAIVHNSYADNPEAFVGQRSILMLEDEFGLNDKAVKCARADNTVMKMSGVKMGIALKSGTGGNVKKIQSAKEIYYNPVDYGYLRLKDHWESAPYGIGIFIPCYYVDSSFRDENGNQNIEDAFEQEIHNRKKLAEGESTAMLDGYIIDHPLVPSEMFLSPELNIFPVARLREQKAYVELKQVEKVIGRTGRLEYTNKQETHVIFKDNKDRHNPNINSFDLKKYDGKTEGNILVLEEPVDNIPDATWKTSLYKIGYDPVKDDNGGTSLAAITVYKGYTAPGWNDGIQNNIVALYIGRFNDVEEIHEVAVKLAIWYNCKILPEIDIPDFIRYAKRRKKLHLLQPKPYDAISKVIMNPSRKHDYGMDISSSKIIIQGEQLLNKWLLEKRGIDENGKEILNLNYLYSLRILDELIHYKREVNTDAISSLFLIMFWIYQEELIPVKPNTKKEKVSRINNYYNKIFSSKEDNSGSAITIEKYYGY